MERPKGYLDLPILTPFGAPVWVTPETDSTMDDAAALTRAVIGTTLVARHQRAGRGRLPGRSWTDTAGESLLCTILLPFVPALPLRVGLAVAHTVEGLTGTATAIKWPNDVRAQGRKVSGVLCQARAPSGGAIRDVWVGIGVNVNRPSQEVSGVRDTAISCEELRDRPTDPVEVLRALLPHLHRVVEPAAMDWWPAEVNARLEYRGAWVNVEGYPTAAETLQAIVYAVRSDGALLVQPRESELVAIHAGEVTALRSAMMAPAEGSR